MTTGKKRSQLRHAEYYDFQSTQDKLYADSTQGKIFHKLVELIVLPQNIKLAYRNLKKNKGSHTAGTDKKTIQYLANLSEKALVQLVQQKLTWYRPQAVRRVNIPKDNGKTRPLGIPTIVDRLVQQCILQVLEPICEAKFHEHSYGFRPNRSQEHALAQVMKNMQRSKLHYVVDIDIQGFFDNVSHGKLLKQLWALGIRDKKLISILSAMLKAEVAGIGFPDRGTPQGSILSPLLSNVVLNEFDWWIASQWEKFPTTIDYATSVNGNGSLCKSNRYTALKKRSNLKLCTAVRFADDFKVFTNSYQSAVKLYHATVQWLKHRLGLDVSQEKSQIVNLKEGYSDFLGLSLTLIKRGKESGGAPKYVAKSHICEKAKSRIHTKLKEHIRCMEYPKRHGIDSYTAVRRYNAYILGIHQYYSLATCVAIDFARLSFPVFQSLVTRLKTRIKPIAELRKKEKQVQIPKYIAERYGQSKMLRFVDGQALIPMAYIHHRNPMSRRRTIQSYTPEGRTHIHRNLGVNTTILRGMMCHPVQGQSIEYNDNRLSLYCGQQGKCAVSGQMLQLGDIHCHHKVPRSRGGQDDYKNLILVTEVVHLLIHATTSGFIASLLNMISLTNAQLQKLNTLRTLAGLATLST